MTMIRKIIPHEEILSQIERHVQCPDENCKKIFMSRSVLNLHFTQCHKHSRIKANPKASNNVTEQFFCPVKSCPYHEIATKGDQRYFKKFKYLKQHYLKVHATRSFNCTSCEKKFATQGFLNAHLKYCDLELNCSCTQNFSSVESLLTHARRKGHHSDSLSVYYQRIKKKEAKRLSSKWKNTSQSDYKASASPQRPGATIFSTAQILPKPQSSHITAAIALSELAFAGFKRLPSVDVGTQTDFLTAKRLARKCLLSPIRNKGTNCKRKQTIEMETQTRLTNIKNKKKKCAVKYAPKCSASTDTSGYRKTPVKDIRQPSYSIEDCNVETGLPEDVADSRCHKQHTYDKGLTENYINLTDHDANFVVSSNTMGTQTSPRVNFRHRIIFQQSDIDNFNYDYLKTNKEGIECVMTQNAKMEDVSGMCATSSNNLYHDEAEIDFREDQCGISTKKSLCAEFDPANIMVDEDDSFESLNSVEHLAPIRPSSQRALHSLSHTRSSTIETQTDHDVFLSNHLQTPDDCDDIILLTSSETQTERDSPSLWCTSETQTCEDFSDIEQFLCSTIHTQTQDETRSTIELFPELNFSTDSQTQTGLSDSPLLVTTQTQTSVLELGSSCSYRQ